MEVPRAIARIPGLDAAMMSDRLRSIFDGLTLLEFDAVDAAAAVRLGPATLRMLDAIHLASALELQEAGRRTGGTLSA